MKKINSLFFFLILLVGCNLNSDNLTERSEYGANLPSMIEEENFILEMKAKAITYSSKVDQITVEIKNFSSDIVGFGEYYQVEKLISNSWFKIPFSGSAEFKDIGYILEPGKSKELTLSVEELDYGLTEGKYRFIKEFWRDGTEIVLAVEFEVVK